MSNIAWRVEDRLAAYELISARGVKDIELAPGLIFASEADYLLPSEQAIERFRSELTDIGLGVVSIQSLLFGHPEAQLFGTPAEIVLFETRVAMAIRLAGALDVPNLVFGCPANRSCPGRIPSPTALAAAVQVFRRLGDVCLANRCRLGLEAVGPEAGSNFLTNTTDLIDFVKQVDHPGVAVTLDTGVMIGDRGLAFELPAVAPNIQLVSHVQISAPGLAGFPHDPDGLGALFQCLDGSGYRRSISLEMRASPAGSLRNLTSAIDSLQKLIMRPDASHDGFG